MDKQESLFMNLVALATLLLTALLWPHPSALFLLLLCLSVSVLVFNRDYLGIFLFSSFLGTLSEMVGVYAGAWTYENALFFVPVWLPLIWGIAGAYLSAMALFLRTYFNAKQ